MRIYLPSTISIPYRRAATLTALLVIDNEFLMLRNKARPHNQMLIFQTIRYFFFACRLSAMRGVLPHEAREPVSSAKYRLHPRRLFERI